MIRILFRICIFLLALGVAGWNYWPQLEEWWNPASRELADDPRIPLSRISLCYELSPDRWTDFPLLKVTRRIKAVTNADVPLSKVVMGEPVYKYAVEYQVISDTGSVLTQGDYHFMSKVTPYRLADDSQSTSGFYYDSDVVPTDGRVLYINLTGTEEAGLPVAVRFRLKSALPPATDVVVRVYQQEAYDEIVTADLWNRLPARVQEKMAIGNVYPHEFLSDEEKINLLRTEFRPLGPVGVQDRDYLLRKMYVLKEVEDILLPDTAIPSGIYCAPNFRATIAIPEEGLDMSLGFTALAPDAGDGQITLQWFGRSIRERKTLSIPYAKGEALFDGHFGGGLVELTADTPMMVKVGTTGSTQNVGVPLYSRVYSTDLEAVRYEVNHQGRTATPFRIDCRVPYLNGAVPVPAITVSFLNDKGISLKTVDFELKGEPSQYDRVASHEEGLHVTDAISRYFSIPKEIKAIEISSNPAVFVTCYNRPPRLTKLTHVPEDYYRGTADILRQPTWFPVSPSNARELKIAGMASLLQVQLRPPQDQVDLLAGRYQWESFKPGGRWVGSYLLTDAVSEELSRTEALGVAFHEILPGRSQTVTIDSPKRLRTVAPKLLFSRKNGRPGKIIIEIDGNEYYRADIIGRQGELFLPPLRVGRHTMRLIADKDGQFYLNSISNKPPRHLLRFAIAIGKKPLTFNYVKKNAEENLTLAYYPLHATSERAKLRIKVASRGQRSFGPSETFTLTDRVFSIRDASPGYLPLFHAPHNRVRQGESFFMPMGPDMDQGEYQVTANLEAGSSGYLLFYRIVPGFHQQRRLLREVLQ